MAFLEDLAAQRQRFLDGLEANKDDINLRVFEDFYPDEAHFIFELLQNAEDTGATTVSFTLFNDRCVFEHNGERHFCEDDVRAITGISNSTKTNRSDEIGKFGMGFKSVFAYTEAPTIYSRDYAFQIQKLVLPVAVSHDYNLDGWTRFEFPFNNPRKSADIAYKDIEAGLERLPDTTLLFLPNLRSVRWHIGSESSGAILRVQHSENHIEVLREVGEKRTASSHFLRFFAPVEGLTKQTVSIAFALGFLPKVIGFDPVRQVAEQLKIVPIAGQVAVYFPAVKETSGLRFHLHAPFVPELSRASVKETPVNAPLFGQLARLAATSLHTIRDLGLLTGEFLAVLPNPQDSLPPRYRPIRDAIIDAMKNQALTPTQAKSHAPAKHLLQAQASLKELLSDDDLKRLLTLGAGPPQWAISATQKNSNQDRFLAGLEIIGWDIEHFIAKLPSPHFQQWLGTKPVDWHQQMYALFHDYYSGLWRNEDRDWLKKLPVVRLSDGSHSTGDKCYFPSAGVDSDPEFPRVDQRVYSSGNNKTQQEKARKLLETIGVREVGEAERVQSILKQRYIFDVEMFGDKTYLEDLTCFMAFAEKESAQASMFSEYYVFKRAGDNGHLHKPARVFLDSPYLETGLTAYFDALGDALGLGPSAGKRALSEWYNQNSISSERLVRFAQAVGVQTKLDVERRSTEKHRCVNTLRADHNKKRVRWTDTAIDEDWMISNLEFLLHNTSEALSRLVWRTLCGSDKKVLRARFRPNQHYTLREQSSSLVLLLQETPWVPQNNGRFVRPLEASRASLPKGFPVDEGYEWLNAVHFGENERQRSEAYRQQQATARELGFRDEESLSEGKWYANLSPEDRQHIKDEYQRKQQIELPERASPNPELRAKRVEQQAAEAPERLTEQRMQSVSVGREAVKQEAKLYLREQYTNSDQEMICQVCKNQAPLPFRLDDGSYYFEAVEFLPELQDRHYQNYLALCPNHAAMYKHANGSSKELKARFLEMEGVELEVVLAQENTTIYFTKTHLSDLRAVISAEQGKDL